MAFACHVISEDYVIKGLTFASPPKFALEKKKR